MNLETVCTSKEFGQKFQTARKRKGKSLNELAAELNKAGVKSHSGAMSRMERDLSEPGVIWAANAAVALDTSLDNLVYRQKLEVQPTKRKLREREKLALERIVEALMTLNDEHPGVEWFEVGAVSAEGTRKTVISLPAGHSVKRGGARGEKMYEPPPEDQSDRMAGEGNGDYGKDGKHKG